MAKPDPSSSSADSTMPQQHPQSSPPLQQPTPAPTQPPAPASTTTASSAKDPSRPRRKKARRACFACQRAHLTCGDERPCQRCIKRGLQDACHDGVRKKAKYLHDAPIDDGPPEFAPQTQPSAASSYPYHPQMPATTATEMLPPEGTINPNSIESPGGLTEATQQPGYSAAPLFDPADPALFNFDIASLNFGSHYGALEFGVLGQMSNGNPGTGGAVTPDNSSGSNYGYSPGLGGGDNYVGFSAPQDSQGGIAGEQWGPRSNNQRGSIGGNSGGDNGGFAGTYMIEAGPGSLTSPSPPVESPRAGYTQPQQTQQPYSSDNPAPLNSPSFFSTPPNTRPPAPSNLQQVQNAAQQTHQAQNLNQPRIRRRDDPSHIYSSITQPYPYALQHHRLFHMLETRFPKHLLLRIARAMAAFRPSFIACTQTLKADDLLFMEKCFQRTLWEYERFIQSCGTPTIVCRRTGEVVGVGKEFCMLTGWDRAVLLGEKRNLNTNRPFATQPPGIGTNLPPPPAHDDAPATRRPVFLAELLDDESVVEFYEQFARLAFGDSRGAVMTTAKVLTYKAPRELGQNGEAGGGGGASVREPLKQQQAQRKTMMENLSGDGKVDCAFCWTIKRDVFDIPMLIVGNFLPILAKAEESERTTKVERYE